MTPRERVLRGIDHQETDRIPIGFNWATSEFITKLKSYYRVSDKEGLLKAMDVDIRRLSPLVYCGEQRYFMGEEADYWGMTGRALKDGDSSNQCPFAEVSSVDEIDAYKWPSPDDFKDVHNISEEIEDYQGSCRIWYYCRMIFALAVAACFITDRRHFFSSSVRNKCRLLLSLAFKPRSNDACAPAYLHRKS